MVEEIKKQEKERVIESVREWLSNNVYEREFDYWNGYYDMCVTSYETEEQFWKAFDEFTKTL